MPRWTPKAEWKGQDVFIIGGGDSLRDFDWLLLHRELTIGCNNAYTHGSRVCKICLFGDNKWFEDPKYKHKEKLAQFKGVVFTCSPHLLHSKIPWLWTVPREKQGLRTNALGWNGNTGASAVNLALILGAKRVFLLGFDMQLSDGGKPNWHDDLIDKTNPDAYRRFLKHFRKVAADLPVRFPGRKIININANSALDLFPKLNPDSFWVERRQKNVRMVANSLC